MGKKLVIIFAVLVFIGLIIGGYAIFLSNKPVLTPTPANSVSEENSDVIPTIPPSDLGLTFTARSDKKAVKFVIANTDDITGVDYAISYTTKSKEGEDVPQGLIGSASVDLENKKIEIKYRELGTCSSGKCRYDVVVSPITLTLKITKKNGKAYQSVTTLSL